MVGEEEIDRVVTGLYEAATEPHTWAASLSRLATLLGGFAANYMLFDKTKMSAFSAISDHYSGEPFRRYLEYYAPLDKGTLMSTRFPVGRMFTCIDFISDEEVRRSEFYNDYFLPLGGRYMAGGRLLENGSISVTIGIHRGPKQEPFGAKEIALLHRMSPHLVHASKVLHRFLELRSAHAQLSAALDQVPWGVIVVDRNGRCLRMNKCAEALVSERDGLRVRQSRIEADNQERSSVLHRAIGRAVSGALGSREPAGESVIVARNSGRGSIAILVAPLVHAEATDDMLTGAARAAILFVADTRERPITSLDVLMALFHLSPHEARVACAIAEGLTIDEIATRCGVERETIRSQMKAVFAKTDANRQAEVASLVAGLPRFPAADK
jgi:DNA-binding CsgD family transcriptional regulator/PAS domain-containing protein